MSNKKGFTKTTLDVNRSLYHTSSETELLIPTNLGLTEKEVCWNRNLFNFYITLPQDTFLDENYFSETCSNTLYNETSNKVGEISLINLIDSFSNFESNSYTTILDQIKINLPNSQHSEISINSENQNLLDSLESKVNNAAKHSINYKNLLGQKTDKFSIFKYNLVGINKNCFASETTYNEIFGLGLMSSIYTLEEYSIGTVGIDTPTKTLYKTETSSRRRLERKLSDLNEQTDDGMTHYNHNILNNLLNQNNFKLKKTISSIQTQSDLHNLAAKSFANLYIVQNQNDKVFLALAILSGIGIIFLAFAEYDYRVTIENKYTKICYAIFLGFIIIGVIICSIIILISQVAVSKVIGKAKDNLCIDSNILLLVEEDLILSKLLIPISIGLAILLIVMILGLALSCHFCGPRWKYRFSKSIVGRFR